MQLLIGREYPDEIIEDVQNAKNSIKILMYEWRWYSHQPGARIQKLNQEIIRAAKRGVRVKAVLNDTSILPILKENGIDARVTNVQRTMHIKLVVIDEKYVFVGSHNFSINGFELNHEMSVRLDDFETVLRCSNFFDRVWLS